MYLTKLSERLLPGLCLLLLSPLPLSAQVLLGPDSQASTPATTRPDLSVGRLSLSRSVAHVGETVEAEVTIENTGTVGVRNVAVRFFLGGTQLGRDYLVDVGPNGRVDVSTEFRAKAQGKQEFLVLLDPDNAISEQRERNNTASRTLGIVSLPSALSHSESEPTEATETPAAVPSLQAVTATPAQPAPVKPEPAPKPPAPAPVATKKAPPPSANLVAQVETIEGLHYFNGREIRVKISNAANTGRAAPSILGLRPARKGSALAATLPVAGLEAGKSITVTMPWPDDLPSGADGPDYVVVADSDNDVNEGAGEDDNVSNMFRPVAVVAEPKTTEAAASLQLHSPKTSDPLVPGQTYTVSWDHSGAVGDRVQLILIGNQSHREIRLATLDNTGSYDWTVPTLGENGFWLALRSADGKTEGRLGPYRLAAAPGRSVTIESPERGAAWFAGNEYAIRWAGAAADAGKLKIQLYEKGRDNPVAEFGAIEVQAASGRHQLALPEDSSLFGQYRLRLTSAAGDKLGESDLFEINPAFVFPRASQDDPTAKEKLTADLTVVDAAFKDGRFNFHIKNLGPDSIPFHVVSGLRMRTYFVKHTPIRNSSDYQICDRRLYLPFETGKLYDFELGRDPSCRFGNLNSAERFEYAIVRLEIPSILDTVIIDKDYLNNGLKFYYPR